MKLPQQPPPLPQRHAAIVFEPLEGDASPLSLIENLLKHPGRIVHELHHQWRPALLFWFLVLGLAGMAIYGVVVGSLTGGTQMLIAPVKLALGIFVAMLICLPSLYIFASLGGIEARIRSVAGTFLPRSA